MNDQRHLQDLWKEIVGMSPSAVFAEQLAMVGREDDHTAIVKMLPLQEIDERAKATIDTPDARGVRRVKAGLDSPAGTDPAMMFDTWRS